MELDDVKEGGRKRQVNFHSNRGGVDINDPKFRIALCNGSGINIPRTDGRRKSVLVLPRPSARRRI